MQVSVDVIIMRGKDILQNFKQVINLSDPVLALKMDIFNLYFYPLSIQNIHCNDSRM